MLKPDSVNILGKVYTIEYVDKPSDVDLYKRESLWGQIDYWTRTIRLYAGSRVHADILDSLLHEVLHGLIAELELKDKIKDKEDEDLVGLLAMGLADTFTRNGWLSDGTATPAP